MKIISESLNTSCLELEIMVHVKSCCFNIQRTIVNYSTKKLFIFSRSKDINKML